MRSYVHFTLAASAFVFVSVPRSTDAAAFQSATVVCHEDALDEICAGYSFFTTPSPGDLCIDPDDFTTCQTIYEGGWSWTYTFIEGFEDGTDLTQEDQEEVAAAETGLEVTVTMEDDQSTCEITVGNETCAGCSAAECVVANVTYDCLNIDMGSLSMDCVEVEPIFYPLELGDDFMTNNTFGAPMTNDEVGEPMTNDEVGEPMTNDEPQPMTNDEPQPGGASDPGAAGSWNGPSHVATVLVMLASCLTAFYE
ncbi:MAG: hypothetical protein SGILL_001412 [Bacillariaceae sp.]